MKIIKINQISKYFNELIALEYALWPDNTVEALTKETLQLMKKESYYGAIIDEVLIGFIQLSVRHDYVNGTDSSPVGFIEGIYVLPNHRKKGVAKQLVEYVSNVLRKKNITEIASDALLENTLSHEFHKSVGFVETERVVYFHKKI